MAIGRHLKCPGELSMSLIGQKQTSGGTKMNTETATRVPLGECEAAADTIEEGWYSVQKEKTVISTSSCSFCHPIT